MIDFIYFFVAIFLSTYIPGTVLLRNLKLPRFDNIVLSTGLGLVLLSFQGLIFGYAHVRILTYVYIAIFCILWMFFFIRQRPSFSFQFPKNISKIYIFLACIIFLGTLGQLTTTWFVGTQTAHGIYFCCGDTRDNILHLAYINELTKHIPPLEPGLSQTNVKNYHYLGHVAVAELIRVFHLPLVATSMQYIPLLLCLLLGGLAIVFSRLVKLSYFYAAWLLFFLYFGGDCIYAITFLFTKQILFQKPSLFETGPHFLYNFPFAFSIVVFFLGLNLFILWSKYKSVLLGLLTAVVFGSIIGYKVNFIFFALGGMGMCALILALKRNYSLLLYTILAVAISIALYLPVKLGNGSFVFVGLWRAENFIVNPLFHASSYELARQVYIAHQSWLRVIQYEVLFSSLFFIGFFGTKILAFFQSTNSLKRIPLQIHIFLLSGIIMSSVIGFFFLQNPGGANSIFFLLAVYIVISIYAALACDWWTKRHNVFSIGITVVIVLVTIPQPLFEIKENMKDMLNRKGFTITQKEIAALDFLQNKTNKNAIVLVNPTNKMSFETPYVQLYTNRAMFLAGQGDELESHAIPYEKQKRATDIIFKSKDTAKVIETLRNNTISYLYMKSNENLPSSKEDSFLTLVFRNDAYKIYRVESNE